MFNLIAPALAFCFTFVITTLCVGYAPFAAFKWTRIAQRKELNMKKHAIRGATYSILLFLPWQQLTHGILGESISRRRINSAYVTASALSFFVLASHVSLVISSPYPSYSFSQILEISDFIVATIIGTLVFIFGLIKISHANKILTKLTEQKEQFNIFDIPTRSYIMPFACAWASMLIVCAPWYHRIISIFWWGLILGF